MERMNRHQGVNLYIKNLDDTINDERLRKEFAPFGTITSAKVMLEEGRSKGFGYVCFSSPEEATKAITVMNGRTVGTRPLYVALFQSKEDRKAHLASQHMQQMAKAECQQELKCKFEQLKIEDMNRHQGVNLYIKNLDDTIDDERLRKEFTPFGTITSAKVKLEEGRSKGFGYVCFSSPEEATKAITEMNGRTVGTKPLYVALFQSKEDRKAHLASQHMQQMAKAECQQELKCKSEQLKIEGMNRYEGVKLFINNLDDTIDDERLREEFTPFGTITSAKVMLEEGRSKGSGFVCFSSPEEAAKAITAMNGQTVGTKPLYVALFQSKEDRKAHLVSQYMQRVANMRVQQMGTQMLQPGSAGGYFVPTLPQPQRFYGPAQMAQIRATPRWPAQLQVCPNAQGGASGFPNMQAPFRTAPRAPGARPGTMWNALSARPIKGQQPVGAANIQGRPVASTLSVSAQGRPTNYKYAANMRNPPRPMPVAQQPPVRQAVHIQGQEPLTAAMLVAVPTQEQKQKLGERLFPLIHHMYPCLAGKITDMLLETDNSELLHMLQHHETLKAKVEESVAVLKAKVEESVAVLRANQDKQAASEVKKE